MSEIENLKKRLAELQSRKKEQQEIKKLKSQIKSEEFSQTTGGKVFNKIADIGQGLGKTIMNLGGGSASSPAKPKKKPMSVDEIIAKLPQ